MRRVCLEGGAIRVDRLGQCPALLQDRPDRRERIRIALPLLERHARQGRGDLPVAVYRSRSRIEANRPGAVGAGTYDSGVVAPREHRLDLRPDQHVGVPLRLRLPLGKCPLEGLPAPEQAQLTQLTDTCGQVGLVALEQLLIASQRRLVVA